MDKYNLLVLCTGNSARSQMAEAFLRKYVGDVFNVYSAGLEPKGINPYTIRVMNEIGFDLSEHRSKSTKEFMGQMFFRYLITVCGHADQNCPLALWAQGGKRIHWPFEDPAAIEGTDAEKLAKFREVRDQIHEQVKSWVGELELQPGMEDRSHR